MYQVFMDIKGMDTSLIELFEAAGYLDVEAFQRNSAEEIYAELERANGMLSLVDNIPSIEQIEAWRDVVIDKEPSSVRTDGEEKAEPEKEVLREDEDAELPFAQPLSRKFIAKHRIQLESLPELLDVKAEGMKIQKTVLPQVKPSLVEQVDEAPKREISKEKLRSFDDVRGEKVHVSSLPKKNGEVDRTKVVNPETNEGVDPHSRKYVRGVLHNDPIGTLFGAYAFILSIILLLGSLAPLVYIVLNREEYLVGLGTPALILLGLMLYFGSARKTACPVCRQRAFVPKSCLKHNKAHHIKGLGNMLPTAIHLISFKWFRCMFCGTSIRVKE